MTIDCSQDSALTPDVLEDIRNELADKLPELRPAKRANAGGPKDAIVRARPKKIKSKVLPEKEFKARASLMTRMLALEDYAGLYNIFAAVVINLTLYMVLADLYAYGSVNLGMANMCAMFGQPLVTWSLLILMHSSSAILFYWTFRAWADNRASFLSMEGVWDLSFSIMLALFVYGFYYIPIQVHWSFKLPPASAAIIVLEQLRLTMKLYAFTRSNVPRVLKSCEDEMNYYFHHYSKRISHGDGGVGEEDKEEEDYYPVPRNLQLSSSALEQGSNAMGHVLPKNQRRDNLDLLDESRKEKRGEKDEAAASACPEFQHFLYFLYAPTLVYRDSYPRTESIRWGFVVKNVMELVGCVYMYNIIHHLTGYVLIEKFGVGRMPRYDLIRFIFFQMITGGLGFILGFFILLQTTQNIGAELLRFGDRQFYLDWWNSDSFGAFYRKWNLPVQDFLYTYIYKEAKEANLDQVSRIFPSVLVFLISSIFHEYVLMFVLQVCYPLLLFLFGGFGMALSFIPNTTGSKQRGNLFFWWSLITGNGLIHAFYMLEYFARANGCPPAELLAGEMEPKLSLVLDDVMAQSASKVPESSPVPESNNDGTSTPPPKRRGVKLAEKEFQYRQSPLTELLEVPHFRTIHHIFIASLILLMLQAVIIDLVETGSVDLGLERLLWALGESQRTWTLIFSLHLSSIFILYPGFYYWAHARQAGSQTGAVVYDKMALTAVSIFMTLFTLIPAVILWSDPLPFGSAIVATMEQGRLLMKMYAFVRSNVPRALELVGKEAGRNIKGAIWEDNNGARLGSMESLDTPSTAGALRLRNVGRGIGSRPQIPDRFITAALKRTESWLSTDNDSDSPCPCFTKYLYFLFAPTFLYRDQYPKTSKIRWNHVCWNFSQVVGCAFYASFILGRSLSANFGTFGLPGHERSLIELLQAVFSLMLPATLTLMLVFFMVLHTWQNAFAEMLYFGDRLFYRDWWNCSSFAVYYKTWNILVHDWLYTYIYKDATEKGLGDKFKALPTILVFFISSIFHEYILATSFHFFFPAVLILFGGFGFVFTFIGDRKKNTALGNILMWVALISGTGIIIAAYSMEHYANINCPKEILDARSVLIPRTFACNAIKMF